MIIPLDAKYSGHSCSALRVADAAVWPRPQIEASVIVQPTSESRFNVAGQRLTGSQALQDFKLALRADLAWKAFSAGFMGKKSEPGSLERGASRRLD